MYVSVDVDLDEFNDDDIINYLEKRGYMVINNQDERVELIESIYLKRRLEQDYQTDLDTLIYNNIGRIV
jgi:hypothetical protein